MNKSIIILTLALAMVRFANCQQVYVAPIAEKTITGVEYGSGIYYKSRGAFACGVFYQTGVAKKAENLQRVNPFYGVGASVPLAKCDRMTFNVNARVGFVNKNFFICVPGLETDIRVFKKVSLGFGMSIRKGAMSGTTNFKFSI